VLPEHRWFTNPTTALAKLTTHQTEKGSAVDSVAVQAGEEGIRFLLVSAKPIEEPVAWYGPIVMNTQEELRQAMTELQSGTFITHRQRFPRSQTGKRVENGRGSS
jgi:redox-sensitive bicupin YhaK (pirin superfamily)